jgi:transposase
VRVVSIYEAGYDDFWIDRALREADIENRVIDAASVPVDRRARRVKTDRLDLEQLIRVLLALERGETRACKPVRVPSPAEEDVKRQHRERVVLIAERTAHSNRITALLMLLGIQGINPRRRDFVVGKGPALASHTSRGKF